MSAHRSDPDRPGDSFLLLPDKCVQIDRPTHILLPVHSSAWCNSVRKTFPTCNLVFGKKFDPPPQLKFYFGSCVWFTFDHFRDSQITFFRKILILISEKTRFFQLFWKIHEKMDTCVSSASWFHIFAFSETSVPQGSRRFEQLIFPDFHASRSRSLS